MARADICPVCKGDGEVKDSTTEDKGKITIHMRVCHGCDGKGWVEVGESDYNPITELGWEWKNSVHDPNRCSSCGGDRNDSALTGCPKGSHYGAYC